MQRTWRPILNPWTDRIRSGGFILVLVLCACSSHTPADLHEASRESGRLLIEQYGCGTCHTVPGVRTATGKLAPPLGRFARRVYIAGSLPNDPDVLTRWIQHPQELVPATTMPDLGVSEQHARDMAAYLYSLR